MIPTSFDDGKKTKTLGSPDSLCLNTFFIVWNKEKNNTAF